MIARYSCESNSRCDVPVAVSDSLELFMLRVLHVAAVLYDGSTCTDKSIFIRQNNYNVLRGVKLSGENFIEAIHDVGMKMMEAYIRYK